MRSITKSGLANLNRLYKNVLIKCFMVGIMAMSFVGAANAVDVATYDELNAEIASNETDINITSDINFTGPLSIKTANTIINGGGFIFDGTSALEGISIDVSASAGVEFNNIDFENFIFENSAGSAFGGVISNEGVISNITNSVFTNNYVKSTNHDAIGGAINNAGTITSITNTSFIGNYAKSDTGVALGGAIATTEDLTFFADGRGFKISGNYTQVGAGAKDYNAIYVDGAGKNITFNLNNGGSYTLNDNIKTNGSNAYTFNVIGNGVGNNDFNLNNILNDVSEVNIDNATIVMGTVTHDSIKYSGSLGNAILNIRNGGGVDFYNSMIHAGEINIYQGSEIIVKTSDFGTIAQDGTFTTSSYTGDNLTNNGVILLKDVGFTDMTYANYANLLTSFNHGNFVLVGVAISTSGLSLKDVADKTYLPNHVVLGDQGSVSDGVFAASLTAILGGVDGNMNNSGTLTLTGEGNANGALVNGDATNNAGGILDLQNGSITGSLTNNGTVNINGQTTISDALTNAGSLNVKSGSFVANGEIILNGGTLRVTNANSGNSINQASAAFLNDINNIGGHIIAEQNSYIVLGSGDSNYAINALGSSNQDWGTSVTAALFVVKPQIMASTGSIKIDGKSTGVVAADANEAKFTTNSLLMIDAKVLGTDTAITSSVGKLTVESGAKIHIVNVLNNQTIKIVEGFTGAGGSIADEAWEGDNLTSSSGLQSVKVADFNTTDGSYSVQVFAAGVDGILKNFPLMQGGTAQVIVGLSPDVDSVDVPTQFLSRATDTTYIGTNNPKKATAIIEGMAQAAGVLGVGATTLDVAKAASNIIASKLGSVSQGTAKEIPSGDDNKSQGLSPWVMPLYNYTSVNGYEAGGLESDYDTSMGGVAFGIDKAFDNYRIGLAFNAGMGSTDAKGDFDGENEFDFYGVSIYGSKNVNDIKITSDIGLTYTSNDVKQYLGALSMSDANADIDSYALSIGAMAEKAFDATNYIYTPYAGLRFTSIYTDSYKMKNDSGIISSTKSDNQNFIQIPVGAMFETKVVDYSDWSLKPKAKAGLIFSFGELEARSNTTFTGVGAAKYNMDNVDMIAFDGGIGIEMQKDDVTINFGYNLLASPNEYSHSVSANIRWDF